MGNSNSQQTKRSVASGNDSSTAGILATVATNGVARNSSNLNANAKIDIRKSSRESNLVSNVNRAKEARQMTVTARRKRNVKIEVNLQNIGQDKDVTCATPIKTIGESSTGNSSVAKLPLTPTSQYTQVTSADTPDQSPHSFPVEQISFVEDANLSSSRQNTPLPSPRSLSGKNEIGDKNFSITKGACLSNFSRDYDAEFEEITCEYELGGKLSGDLSEKLSKETLDSDNEDDDGSLGSNSMFSQSQGSGYGSIGPDSISSNYSCSIGEVSATPSTASFFQHRRQSSSNSLFSSKSSREQVASCTSTALTQCLSTTANTNHIHNNGSAARQGDLKSKPSALNAFETLPQHLIESSLLRQAASTLRDERFLSRRILKLGAIAASRVHVADLMSMEKKIHKDAVRLEEKRGQLEAAMPTCGDFADGDDLESVTIESLELFEKCILELCGIQAVVESDITEGESFNGRKSTCLPSRPKNDEAKVEDLRKISLLDGGRALYSLGKYCQKADWNDDAMEFYKHSLYLFFLDLGVEESRLLDNSDDCDGFFYVHAASQCVHDASSTHEYLGRLFTKMGDVHGQCQEKNDALRAYRASEVFWRRYISDLELAQVDNVKQVVAAVEARALCFNRIGGVYTAKGQLEAATVAFNEALEMQIKTLGEDHLEVGKTLHNIGVCHRHNDDWDAALDFYMRAYEILENYLGQDHLDTVRTLHNIGGVYRRQREYAKAMECFKEVLHVRRKVLGDDHPSVAITLVSMGAVLRRCGMKEEANKFYAAAVN
jgi:tetratricopeptide (TPR) repeat protein